jgi:hypothetical protein
MLGLLTLFKASHPAAIGMALLLGADLDAERFRRVLRRWSRREALTFGGHLAKYNAARYSFLSELGYGPGVRSCASYPLWPLIGNRVTGSQSTPAYSWATVGSPFALPYGYQASFPAMKEGLYAIGWPDAETAFNLLFSPARGLFFWSPFLLMAGLGYPALFRRSAWFFWFTYAVPVLQMVVISGRVWDWPAGPTFGARLLTPMIPLLALPCALGLERCPWLGILLASYSALITTLATLTDACPSSSIYNPLTDLHIPLFLKGQFSPNLGMVLGLPPYTSVALYYVILVGGFWWLWRRLPAERAAAERTSSSA